MSNENDQECDQEYQKYQKRVRAFWRFVVRWLAVVSCVCLGVSSVASGLAESAEFRGQLAAGFGYALIFYVIKLGLDWAVRGGDRR